MRSSLPLFPVAVVGSWPRSYEVLRALRDKRANRLNDEEFERITGEAILNCLHLQEEAGVELDAQDELGFAISLINAVTDGFRERGTKIGVHVCRGNWSTQEDVLLRGSYEPLIPHLASLEVDQLVLEFATPRAGEVSALKDLKTEVGLGVVNPRTSTVETTSDVISSVESALKYVPAQKIFLNPDCGFGTFAQRPMNDVDTALRKLRVCSEAAQILRT